MDVVWEEKIQEQFKQILAKMPVFLRGAAQKAISRKAEDFVKAAGRPEVTEKDLVDALFAETPFGFQGLMKNDLNSLSIDYAQYGYDK